MIVICLERTQQEFTVRVGEGPVTVAELKGRIAGVKGYLKARQSLRNTEKALSDDDFVGNNERVVFLALSQYPISVSFQENPAISVEVSPDMTGLEVLRLSLCAYQLPCSGGHLGYAENWASLSDDEEIGELAETREFRLYPAAKVTLSTLLGTVIYEKYLCIHKPIRCLLSSTADRYRVSPNIRAMTESGVVVMGTDTLQDLGIYRDLRLFLLNPSPFRPK